MNIVIDKEFTIMLFSNEELLEFRTGAKAKDGCIYKDQYGNDIWLIIINTKEKYEVVKEISDVNKIPFIYLKDCELDILMSGQIIDCSDFVNYKLAIGTPLGLQNNNLQVIRQIPYNVLSGNSVQN